MEVLVLNAHRVAVSRVSWQDAFVMVCAGRAEILEEYEDRVVRTAREVYPMPAVIRYLRATTKFFRKGPRFNRTNVYLRDKGICQYCGIKVDRAEFQIEHVIPRAQGGKSTWENVVVACHRCNQKKEDKTPAQAKMPLLSKPSKPKSLPGTFSPVISWSEGMPKEWKSFIASVHYWHDKLEE